MNLFAPQHFIPILIILLLLFGRGKISEFMGDFAKGIKSFRKGLSDDEATEDSTSTANPIGSYAASREIVSSKTSDRRSSKFKS